MMKPDAETLKIEAEEAAEKAARKVEEEFREDEKRSIAMNLIEMNLSNEQVAQATGLSVSEVAQLRTGKL